MVLDAVARIEHSLTVTKDAPTNLTETLSATMNIVEQAKQRAEAALQGQPTAEKFAVAYRSIRAIREIAWTLREYGSEAGICDGLDAQANTIDRSLDQIAATSAGESIAAIFDDLIQRLQELTGSELLSARTPAPDVASRSAPFPAATSQADTTDHETLPAGALPPRTQSLVTDTAPPAPATAEPAEFVTTPAASEAAAAIDTSTDDSDWAEADAGTAMNEKALAADEEAQDIAVLDMIAMEMSAPDPEVDDDALDDSDDDVAINAEVNANPQSLDEAFDLRRESPASLGAALIANGTIRPRSLIGANRFAAIQRLSQAEKVALFS
jgi:hypothetical protein